MSTEAEKFGSSIRVQIPFGIAEKYGIKDGTTLKIEEEKDGILLKPVEESLSLDELLRKITDENRHEEYFSNSNGEELL